jgi:hypothetical protein
VIDNEERIETTWLLTSSTSERENWESTMINKDLFRHLRSSQADVEKVRLSRGIKSLRTITDAELPGK